MNEQQTADRMITLQDVQRGYDAWAAKPHNAKWVRKIDGTPIANDIVVNVFEALKDQPASEPEAGIDAPSGILRQTQLNMHDPENGIYGDCWRTAVACLLQLPIDAVPHVCNGPDDGKASDRMRAFLESLDCALLQIPFLGDLSLEQVLEHCGSITISGGLHWCLMGKSRTGCNHVVICKGNEIIHDPSITQSGIVGPADDGLWWAEWIVRRPPCDAMPIERLDRAAQNGGAPAELPPDNAEPPDQRVLAQIARIEARFAEINTVLGDGPREDWMRPLQEEFAYLRGKLSILRPEATPETPEGASHA